MADLSGNPLAEALNRRREAFNQRFLHARQQNRRLDGAQFAEVLRTRAAPLAEALAGVDPSRLDSAVSSLYDTCLRLTALDLLGPGSRLPALDRAFAELLPAAARWVASDPERVIGAVANAVYNLAMEPGADVEAWLDTMLGLVDRAASAEQWLQAGGVAAWRHGMAHYREAALVSAESLPAALLGRLFDIECDDVQALLQRLADPWAMPADDGRERQLGLVGRAGGFVGFAGPFVEPPEVARFGERLFAFDNRQAWLIFADRFGVVLRRYGTGLPEGAPVEWSLFGLDHKGNLSRGEHKASLPELAGWSSLAATEDTLVVTLPQSHHLFLVALA